MTDNCRGEKHRSDCAVLIAQDRMMFTVKGREIVEWWAALDKSAIAKARGGS